MNVIKRKNTLVRDIVNETEQFKSWNHLDLATWDAVHNKVNEVIQAYLNSSMMEYAEAAVGLDQNNKDFIWIEIEVVWESGRDADNFIIFIRPDGTFKNLTSLAADYDRAMGIV